MPASMLANGATWAPSSASSSTPAYASGSAYTRAAAAAPGSSAAAVPVGVGELGQDPADAREQAGEGRDVGAVVGVEQRAGVLVGQRVHARRRVRGGIVDGDQARDGLLLEPLARVALVDAG